MQMKFILLVLFFFGVYSCGKSKVDNYEGPSNIKRSWYGYQEGPSLAGIDLNRPVNASFFLHCNGKYEEMNRNIVTSYQGPNAIYDPYAPNGYNNYNSFYSPNYPYHSGVYSNYPSSYNDNYKSLYENRYKGVASAPKGQMIISATSENKGTIRFGELAYVGAFNPHCHLLSNQILDFEVSGNRLILCFKMPNQHLCLDYESR